MYSLGCCFPDNAHIQPEIAVAHIKRIVLIAVKNTFEIFSWTSESFYLGQACYSRLYKISELITRNGTGKTDAVGMHMRARTNNAHIANYHIQKLGKFIQA